MNLIKKGEKYYHNQLRVMPPSPSCTFDDDGCPVWKEEKFYLKYVQSYTEEDLFEYFVKQTGHIVLNKKRQLAGLLYILGENDVDTVLFAIDELAYSIAEGRKVPKVTLEIGDYIPEGMDSLANKKARDKENGIVDDGSRDVPF
jgi:hypothetical protein